MDLKRVKVLLEGAGTDGAWIATVLGLQTGPSKGGRWDHGHSPSRDGTWESLETCHRAGRGAGSSHDMGGRAGKCVGPHRCEPRGAVGAVSSCDRRTRVLGKRHGKEIGNELNRHRERRRARGELVRERKGCGTLSRWRRERAGPEEDRLPRSPEAAAHRPHPPPPPPRLRMSPHHLSKEGPWGSACRAWGWGRGWGCVPAGASRVWVLPC